jgi:Acetyltransferase (GNAT) domain
MTSTRGYLHPSYAASLAEIGTPRELPHCRGWFLERVIPGSDLLDGMGCYPLFACRSWAHLPEDLRGLREQLISLSLITDPFGEFDARDLDSWFDVVVPYKQHYVLDLRGPVDRVLPRRHRRNTASALKRVQLDVCDEPLLMLDAWNDLYGELAARHGITGVRAFSRAAFEKQFGVPGLMMFRASVGGSVVGLHLWYVQHEVAYGHLGATNTKGYEVMASYALYWFAIEQLRSRVEWLDLGSSAGLPGDASGEGLRQFKAGWSSGVRQTYLCGSIFQPEVYAALTSERQAGGTSYFPAYRHGELTAASTKSSVA